MTYKNKIEYNILITQIIKNIPQTTLLKEKQILPIYKSSAISLIEIAYFMGVTPAILAQIIEQDIQKKKILFLKT